MPISTFDATIPVFIRGLTVLQGLLDKGVSFAEAQGLAPSALVEARLAPDMLTLAGQVQRASDTAKFGAARLTGTEAPSFADDETTVDQLRERCRKTIAHLRGFAPEAFEGSDERPVTFGGAASRVTLPGRAYLLSFALPNFFFHVATAHDILRHEGVPIGKRDYLGPFDGSAA